MALSEERLVEIEARANAATPGPWRTEESHIDGYIVAGNGERIFGGEYSEGFIAPEDPNAIFTVHARDDVPALVAEVRRAHSSHQDERRLLMGLVTSLGGQAFIPDRATVELPREATLTIVRVLDRSGCVLAVGENREATP
jgi:hypothetical protein